jgi:hypothetical protein
MKKVIDRGLTSRAARKRGLQLSPETIRVLRSDEMSRAISGCQAYSDIPTQQTNQTAGTTATTCTKI